MPFEIACEVVCNWREKVTCWSEGRELARGN